jgi:myo-inositol 2-dehydrogenase/D-chiro-inositol 1-dehydrogenase
MAGKVNIGIIGAGRIGYLHARNLSFHVPGANVSAISDIAIDRAKQCAAECNVPAAHSDYRKLLEDDGVEAIYICSSSDTHTQLICEGAGAGKHIFCEKPIDIDPAKIDTALDAVSRAGVKLQIGFNRRFDPSIKRARDLIAQGEIGTPHVIRITSRDPEPPPVEYIKSSGGMFLDMSIHDFDMCRFMAGEEVVQVYAAGTSLVDPKIKAAGDIDTAVTTLTYESGALCSIDNSRRAVFGYDQRVEVFGSEGCVVVENPLKTSTRIYSGTNVRLDLPCHFFMDRYKDAFIEESRHFIECVLKDKTPAVTGKDGKISVLMGLAAMKSLKENRVMPFDPNL